MAAEHQNHDEEEKPISPTNIRDQIESHSYHVLSPEAEIPYILDEKDEIELENTSDIENSEKQLLPSPTQAHARSSAASGIIRPWSNFSLAATSVSSEKPRSRWYRYIQLEQSLTSANIFSNYQDRLKFQQDYREALRDNKFEDFAKKYHKRLQDHKHKINRERINKMTKAFTFVDLEKNFLARDPTRDIKIIFVDDPATPKTQNETKIQRFDSGNFLSYSKILSDDDDAIEKFYENRLEYLLENPSNARDEITLFARRIGELLQERLPRLSRVPHRVNIVDQRDVKRNIDERTQIQMEHKHKLLLIEQRQQSTKKMMIQARRNQMKMEKINRSLPLRSSHLSHFRDLFNHVNQNVQTIELTQPRPSQTSYHPKKILHINTDSFCST